MFLFSHVFSGVFLLSLRAFFVVLVFLCFLLFSLVRVCFILFLLVVVVSLVLCSCFLWRVIAVSYFPGAGVVFSCLFLFVLVCSCFL